MAGEPVAAHTAAGHMDHRSNDSTSAMAGPSSATDTTNDIAPQRELRQRSAISAHRPRPALTSSARGLAKLEMRRQKELEANEAYARANAMSMEQSTAQRGVGSQKSDAQSRQDCASSQSSEGAETIDENVAPEHIPSHSQQSHDANVRDFSSQPAAHGSSQSDFFATPFHDRGKGSVLTQQNEECATEEQKQPNCTVQAAEPAVDDSSTVPPLRMDPEKQTSGQKHAHTANAEPALDGQLGRAATEPARKKPRTFVEPEDEFDDDDDFDFFESLAEAELDWNGLEGHVHSSPIRSHARPELFRLPPPSERPQEDSGFSVTLFKKANHKPIALNSAGARARFERFRRVLEDAADEEEPSDDATGHGKKAQIIVKQEKDAEVTAIDPNTMPPAQADSIEQARQGNASVATPLQSTRALQTTAPLRDRTNASSISANLSPRKFANVGRLVHEVDMPPIAPDGNDGAQATQSPSKQAAPAVFSSAKLTPLKSTPLKIATSKRLGAGRLASPATSRLPLDSPLKASSGLTALLQRSGRVSIGGMLQRKRSINTQFKTPFKSEADAQIYRQNGPYGSKILPSSERLKSASHTNRDPGEISIFDLCTDNRLRQRLAQAIVKPEGTSYDMVRGWLGDACDDVATILSKPKLARRFAFPIGQDGMANVEDAREFLIETVGCGPDSISMAWVRNHYGLIVWKLASIVRHIASPDSIWTYEEVCRQLCYRYEREINRAERSAIKRIQEHDSSPGRTMILCVYEMYDVSEQTFTLTDGWYLIEASFDEPLKRAISKNLIKLGSKLMICKASLTSDSDAAEPITAFQTSFLRINGNATKLARWDSRLGFVKTSPIASARSLTCDGGLVPMVDVVVLKVFPTAYVEDRPVMVQRAGEQSFSEDAWSEQEESERVRKWEEEQGDAVQNVEDILAQKTQRLDDIFGMLCEACGEAKSQGEAAVLDIDPSSCEGTLDAMLSTDNPASYLRMRELVPALRILAEARLERMRSELRCDLRSQIDEICPPRMVKNFCQLRVCDTAIARAHQSSTASIDADRDNCAPLSLKLSKCRRTMQIRLWNVAALSIDDRPKEGQRIRITNLVPTRKSQWPSSPDEEDDIHLATTASTRFIPVSK